MGDVTTTAAIAIVLAGYLAFAAGAAWAREGALRRAEAHHRAWRMYVASLRRLEQERHAVEDLAGELATAVANEERAAGAADAAWYEMTEWSLLLPWVQGGAP